MTKAPNTPAFATPMPSVAAIGANAGVNQPTPQTEGGRLIMALIRAYNDGQLDAALALFDEHANVSDCDFRGARVVLFDGKTAIREWLSQRIADHDQLIVYRIEESSGVVGVEYARRSSDTLRLLGYPNGIRPMLATKVVLTEHEPKRIGAFANGPGGGDPKFCRPEND